jgi:hypothetical protein
MMFLLPLDIANDFILFKVTFRERTISLTPSYKVREKIPMFLTKIICGDLHIMYHIRDTDGRRQLNKKVEMIFHATNTQKFIVMTFAIAIEIHIEITFMFLTYSLYRILGTPYQMII